MWWDAARIQATVTRQFVCSHLLPEEIERLDRPLSFGDGLTDGTYWEWIEEKAKTIFLILLDLGVPDQIFGVVDDSWDDNDLPIARDQVERLALTPAKDERSERKFYYRQFYYLLKHLRKGEHLVYQDSEVVPLDVVEKRTGLTAPGTSGNHSIDKVTLPSYPGQVFCRRRIPIGSGPGCLAHEDFQDEINSIRNVQNDHLVSYFSSYVYQGNGYVLFTPASDASLKSMLATMPTSVKNLGKEARRLLVVNWIHCLVDTLSFIHSRGLSHGNIRPSTVLLNSDNHIFFSDFTRLNADLLAGAERGASSFDKEAYDYAAPEQWFRPGPSSSSSFGPGGGSLSRKNTLTSLAGSPENAGFQQSYGNGNSFSISRGAGDHHPSSPTAMMHAPNPHLNPQAADVFSLGCVILELLGFLMKRPTRSFAAHRAARHKTPGRGGAVLDSSFHRNLGQVEGWMTTLAKEARKKEGAAFRGVAPTLHLVERMLALHPSERPSIHDVQTRMYRILTGACGISEPHCVHQYGGWDYTLGSLKMTKAKPILSSSSSSAAAAAMGINSSGGGILSASPPPIGAGVVDDDEDTISIAGSSKRSSGNSIRGLHMLHLHQHGRTNSNGGRVGGGGGAGWAESRETSPRPVRQNSEPTSPTRELGHQQHQQQHQQQQQQQQQQQHHQQHQQHQQQQEQQSQSKNQKQNQLTGGLLAIRNLQIGGRDKVRSPWQAQPAFAGVSVG